MLPSGIRTTPSPFQLQGLNWMLHRETKGAGGNSVQVMTHEGYAFSMDVLHPFKMQTAPPKLTADPATEVAIAVEMPSAAGGATTAVAASGTPEPSGAPEASPEPGRSIPPAAAGPSAAAPAQSADEPPGIFGGVLADEMGALLLLLLSRYLNVFPSDITSNWTSSSLLFAVMYTKSYLWHACCGTDFLH